MSTGTDLRSVLSQLAATKAQAKEEGDVSLLEFLDLSQLNCLNESSKYTLRSIVEQKRRNTSQNYLLSDADEQLILNIHFNQTVRVKQIVIQSNDAEQAPKKLKLVINRPSVGFDDLQDAVEPAVAQVLELSPEDVKEGNPIALRYVRFQTVNSLHIFVNDNHGGGDETRIDSIDVIGTTVETTKSLEGLAKRDDELH